MALPTDYYHTPASNDERYMSILERARIGRSNFAPVRHGDPGMLKDVGAYRPEGGYADWKEGEGMVKPDSAPVNGDDEPVTTQQIVFTGARYAIYGGIGWLIADTWLGGRGLIGAGVGLVGGYMIEQAVAHQLMTEEGQ